MYQKTGNDKKDAILTKQMKYDKKDRQILQNTLKYTGLKMPQQIDYRAVKIYQIDHIHQIFSKNEDKQLPHIVLLHGFGGTSMTFIKFFKNLYQYYRIHALDAFGVGHSSSGVFKTEFTYDQVRHYYIDAIEQWRNNINIQEFILVGHSFGGYLAACYTESYPNRVSRLIMLSPAGATEKTPQQAEKQLKNRYKNDGIRGKFFSYFAEKFYNLHIKPSKAMGSFFIGPKLIDRIVDVRFKLRQQQNKAWKSYLGCLGKRQCASQIGFYIIFEWPLKTKNTIETMIKRMNFSKPIQFYYGQYDWMDSKGAENLVEQFDNVKFDRISEADHQLIFDNPDQICYYILLRRTPQQLASHSKIYIDNNIQNTRWTQNSQQSNQNSQKKQLLEKLQNIKQPKILDIGQTLPTVVTDNNIFVSQSRQIYDK